MMRRLFSLLLPLLPLYADVPEYHCLSHGFGYATYGIASENEMKPDGKGSCAGDGTFTINQAELILTADNAHFDYYVMDPCADGTTVDTSDENVTVDSATCVSPTLWNKAYFRSMDVNSSLRLTFNQLGITIEAPAAEVTLIEPMSVSLTGPIQIRKQESGPVIGLDGNLTLTTDSSGALSFEALQSDGAIALGNLLFKTNVSINSEKTGFTLAESVYLKSVFSSEDNPGIRIFPNNIAFEPQNPPTSIPLTKSITLDENVKLEILSLIPRTGAITSSGRGAVKIDDLSVSNATAVINLTTKTLEAVTFPEAISPYSSYSADTFKRKTWHFTLINDKHYLASDMTDYFSQEQNRTIRMPYGFLADTSVSNGKYRFQSRDNVFIDVSANGSVTENTSILTFSKPEALHANQAAFQIVHVTGRTPSIPDAQSNDLHPLELSDDDHKFRENLHAAINQLPSPYYNLVDSGNLWIEADWFYSSNPLDGHEYLYRQLSLTEIASLDINKATGKLTDSLTAFTAQEYKFTIPPGNSTVGASGKLSLKKQFSINYKSTKKISVSVNDDNTTTLVFESGPTFKTSYAALYKDGNITLTGIIELSQGSQHVTINGTIAIDSIEENFVIYPDTSSTIVLGSTSLFVPNGLKCTFAQPFEGKFAGGFSMSTAYNEGFSFEGTGVYDIDSKTLKKIDSIYTQSLKDDRFQMSEYLNAVILDDFAIFSAGFDAGSSSSDYEYTEGTIKGDIGTYHFASYDGSGALIDFILHNVSVHINPANGELLAVTNCPAWADPEDLEECEDNVPALEYSDSLGVKYRINGATIALNTTTGLIEMTTPQIESINGSAQSIDIDGSVFIDYRKRSIALIEPNPGTGLILNKDVGVYSKDSITHSGGILTISGKIDIGPPHITNVCFTTEPNCITFNGTLRYDMNNHHFLDITTTDGTVQLPKPKTTTVTVKSLVSIQGTPYMKSEENGLKVSDGTHAADAAGLIIDLARKEIVGVKNNDVSYVWVKTDTSFTPSANSEMTVTGSGNIFLHNGTEAPKAFEYTDTNSSIEEISAGATVQIKPETSSVTVANGYIDYGRYRISIDTSGTNKGAITEAYTADGHGYFVVTKPYFTMLADNTPSDKQTHINELFNTASTATDPNPKRLLFYEDSINVGQKANTITPRETDPTKNKDLYFYVKDVKRYGDKAEDIKMASGDFELDCTGNQLVFHHPENFALDQKIKYRVLPDLTFPSLWMDVYAENSGFNFELGQDQIKIESKFSTIGGDFLGLGSSGDNKDLLDFLAGLLFLDIGSDPNIILSQKRGVSQASQYFGIKNLFSASNAAGWTKYISRVQSARSDNLLRVDLDFLTQTFGGSIMIPLTSMGNILKMVSDDATFIVLAFHVQKNAQSSDLNLKDLYFKVQLPDPIIRIPASSPVFMGVDAAELTLENFTDISRDNPFKATVTLTAVLNDETEMLSKFEEKIGLPILQMIGSAAIATAPGDDYFKIVLNGESILLDSYTMGKFEISFETSQTKDELKLSGMMIMLPVTFETEMSIVSDIFQNVDHMSDRFSIHAKGSAKIVIPPFIPIIHGKSFGGLSGYADMVLIDEEWNKAQFGAIIGVDLLFVKLSVDCGLQLAPDFEVYVRDQQATEQMVSYYLGEETPVAFGRSARTPYEPIDLTLEAGHDTPMIAVSGDLAPIFDVIFPDGTRYDFDDCFQGSPHDTPYPDTLFFLVDEPLQTTYLALNHPEAGTYRLIPKNAINNLQVRIIDPAKQIGGALIKNSVMTRASEASYTLTLENVKDADVTLYAVKEKKLNLGTPISETHEGLGAGSHRFTIDTNNGILHSGHYYVYAKIEQPGRVPRFVWLEDAMQKIYHDQSHPHHEDISVKVNAGTVEVDWIDSHHEAYKYHKLHVYHDGVEDPAHVMHHFADAEVFTIEGLAPETDYEVRIESVNNDGFKTVSQPVAFRTTREGFTGAPDLYVDENRTIHHTQTEHRIIVTVCNRGTADAENALMDIYYNVAQPHARIEETHVGPLAKGACKQIEVPTDADVYDFVTTHHADSKDALIIKIDETAPREYAYDDNHDYVPFSDGLHLYPPLERTIALKKGWNCIALPLYVKEVHASEFGAVSDIYEYDPYLERWYHNPHELHTGRGYWIKSDSDKNITVKGQTYTTDITDVKPGWHIFGSGEEVTDIQSHTNVDVAWIYRDGTWVLNPESIAPGECYWTKIKE